MTFPLGYLESGVGRLADEVLYLELVSVSRGRQDDVTFLPRAACCARELYSTHARLALPSADWTFGFWTVATAWCRSCGKMLLL